LLILFINNNSIFSQHWEGIGIEQGSMVSSYKCLYTDTITDLLNIGGVMLYANGTAYSGIFSYDGVSFNSLGTNTSCLHGWLYK